MSHKIMTSSYVIGFWQAATPTSLKRWPVSSSDLDLIIALDTQLSQLSRIQGHQQRTGHCQTVEGSRVMTQALPRQPLAHLK